MKCLTSERTATLSWKSSSVYWHFWRVNLKCQTHFFGKSKYKINPISLLHNLIFCMTLVWKFNYVHLFSTNCMVIQYPDTFAFGITNSQLRSTHNKPPQPYSNNNKQANLTGAWRLIVALPLDTFPFFCLCL